MATRGLSVMQKISYRWKQGWNEIPEVMGSTGFALFGLVGIIYQIVDHQKKENRTKKFKHDVIIYRPDDPRVAQLHRDGRSPPITSTPR